MANFAMKSRASPGRNRELVAAPLCLAPPRKLAGERQAVSPRGLVHFSPSLGEIGVWLAKKGYRGGVARTSAKKQP
jgi:hypothetical protein